MQLIYTPTLPPGCCFICRAAQRDSYIDTGVSHDYEGAFYICNMCLGEMAQIFAYLSFDDYKDLRHAKEDLERLNFELMKRLGELEKLKDALGNAGFRYYDDGTLGRLGGYSAPTYDSPNSGLQAAKDDVGSGEGTPSESSNDERMAELHSDEQPAPDEFSFNL